MNKDMNKAKKKPSSQARKCGLCGKRKKLTRTECCGQWICDDEEKYVMFSYATTICHRNHRRYTLCGYHDAEDHEGEWQTCAECRASFETEMYVWYGTNEHNFIKLQNPPPYEPTICAGCGIVIRLGEDGYSIAPDKQYLCQRCTEKKFFGKERRTKP